MCFGQYVMTHQLKIDLSFNITMTLGVERINLVFSTKNN